MELCQHSCSLRRDKPGIQPLVEVNPDRLSAHAVDLLQTKIRGQDVVVQKYDFPVQILQMTEDGTEEIISKRSKAYQELDINIEEMPLQELLDLVQTHPGLLRRPIIMDEKRLQVGYNEDEIRRFLPREVRALELRRARELAGF